MPDILSGLVDTEDILADEKKVDMADEIAMLDPEDSQFTTMMMDLGSEPAIREKINWLEDELFPRLSAASGSGTSAATTVNVTASQGDYFRAGDVCRFASTGECFRVNSVSTDALTVTRGVGDVTAAAFADAEQIVIIGNAARQGGTLGTRKITKRVLGYNYQQIFRHPFGFTNTDVAISEYGGSNPEKEEVKKAVEHKRAIELSAFFGARDLLTLDSAANPTGFMGGVIEYLSTNIDSSIGTLTAATFETIMRDALQKGHSRNKVVYAAPVTQGALSGFLRGAWQPPTVDKKKWGAFVDAYINGSFGVNVPVVVKRDWNDFSTANNQYGGIFFVIDMKSVKLRPLRKTVLLRNRQANDADETTHEYLTETSMEVRQEKHHALGEGVTG